MGASDPLQGIASQEAVEIQSDSQISPDGLGGASPKDRLEAAEAAQRLREMGLQDFADLMEYLEKLTAQRFKRLDELMQSAQTLIGELTTLRDLYLQDAETQYAITRVFQERLVITEKIEDGKPITAKVEPAAGQSEQK